MSSTLDILVVGLRFGREFLHLYQSHPGVGRIGIIDTDPTTVADAARSYGISDTYRHLDEALATNKWDAVHILAPVRFHVDYTLKVLATGRSCASAVPIATSIDDIDRVIERAGASKGRYMMMETSVYQREYFLAQRLLSAGTLGRISFLRGAHLQDLDGYPPYWMGYPPMQYATHLTSPILALTGASVTEVACLGSGIHLGPHRGDGSNPFPIESALLRLDRDQIAAEITVAFFEMARSYTEGFSVYGDRGSMEWPQLEQDGKPVVYAAGPADGANRGREISATATDPGDQTDTLPVELRPWVRGGSYTPPGGLPPIEVGAWHGGSHPFLVHEFVSSVLADRPAAIDEFTAARFTAPGIRAHESALKGGQLLDVPRYRR